MEEKVQLPLPRDQWNDENWGRYGVEMLGELPKEWTHRAYQPFEQSRSYTNIPIQYHRFFYSLKGWEKYGHHLPYRYPNEIELINSPSLDYILEQSSKSENQTHGLESQNLIRVFLSEVNLQRIFAVRAQMQGSYLKNAQLHEANLTLIQLQGAGLNHARLFRADLVKSQLQGANLTEAQLLGTNLYNAKLLGAYLNNAQLQGADLRKAQFDKEAIEPYQILGAIIGVGEDDIKLEQTFDLASIRLTGENIKPLLWTREMWGFWCEPRTSYQFFERIDVEKYPITLTERQEIENYYKKTLRRTEESKIYWTEDRIKEYCQNLRFARGVREGVNGLFYERNQTVAFIEPPEEADSMKGNSLDVVKDNLKRARWQIGFSLLMPSLLILFTRCAV